MSLFASSFETGLNAGPSTNLNANSNKGRSHKRKRPSTGAAEVNKDDQLRATQKNLERLMKAVEKGGLEGSSKGQGLGSSSEIRRPGGAEAKKKIKDRKSDNDRSDGRSMDGFDNGPNPGGAFGGKNANLEQRKGEQSQPSPTSSKKPKEGKKKQVEHSAKSKSQRKPVELPLPPPSHEEDSGLTSLQKGMKAKLEGARFRWINEQLYSTPSTEAVAMMKKDPKIFSDYHMTHRALTSAWPSPPLPYIIDLLDPLPRGTVIADLGCGDAGLARALVPKGKVVLSYDLVGDNGVGAESQAVAEGEGWVVQADFLSNIPLPGRPGPAEELKEGEKRKKGKARAGGSEVVDAVVCCLSLMGTNWVGGIYEACRVLKQGGVFHVAEVTSRFTSTKAFVDKVESFGFELENEESPSTHFTLFRFIKTTHLPVGPVRGQEGWSARVREGEDILQACVYKKR